MTRSRFEAAIYLGIVTLISIYGVTSQGHSVLKDCDCNLEFTVANCSTRNLTEIPSNSLAGLQEIDFSVNSITRIQSSEWLNYTLVYMLNLSTNRISEIEENAFHNLIHLEYLYLSNNNISYFSPTTFNQNSILKKLYLNQNPLIFPSKGSFLESNSIIYLDISLCKLTILPPDIFASLPELQSLRLDGNPINITNFKVFEPLTKLEEIYMESNSCLNSKFNERESYFTKSGVDYYGSKICNNETISTSTTVHYEISYTKTPEYPSITTPPGISQDFICLVCWCSEGDTVYADCAYKDINDMPLNNLTHLDHLVLSNNNIQSIKSLYWTGYTSVAILELSNNAIEYLEENAFQNLVKLEYLDLSFNKISNLHTSTFDLNKVLRELNLANNPLIIPSQGAFLVSKSIAYLNLSFCNLFTLSDETFIYLPLLTVLGLNGNPIVNINATVFEPLQYLEVIHMNLEGIECMMPTFIETLQFFSTRGITYSGPQPCTLELFMSTTSSSVIISTTNETILNETQYIYKHTSPLDSVTAANKDVASVFNENKTENKESASEKQSNASVSLTTETSDYSANTSMKTQIFSSSTPGINPSDTRTESSTVNSTKVSIMEVTDDVSSQSQSATTIRGASIIMLTATCLLHLNVLLNDGVLID